MRIKFQTGSDHYTRQPVYSPWIPIPGMSDVSVEAAVDYYEKLWGLLPLDERTDFPNFEIQDDNGEFIAGG